MIKKERFFAVQRVLKFVALLALAMPLALASCSSSSDSDDEDEWGEDYDPEYMKVCEHVANAANRISDIYADCKSIGELSEYEDEIRNIRYVEDVRFSNSTMFVDIKDYGTIMYCYFPRGDFDSEEFEAQAEMIRHYAATRSDDPSHPLFNLETAIVVNQQFNDEGRQYCKDISDVTKQMLSDCGINCKQNNHPTIDFYQNEMFKYDIVFLISHGFWEESKKVHWLFTTESPTDKETEKLTPGKIYKYKDYKRDRVALAAVNEDRDGIKDKDVWYAVVSEKYIEDSELEFNKYGKSIFFNVACQSLMGEDNDWKDNNKKNYSLAKILKEKGVGAYLGYDETNRFGQIAGMLFFGKMASGMSIKNAYETLPYVCLHDNDSDDKRNWLGRNVNFCADLLPYYSEYNTQIASSKLTGPVLEEFQDVSTISQLSVKMQGKSPLYAEILVNSSDIVATITYNEYFKYFSFRYGFEYATKEDFSDAIKTKGLVVGTKDCTLSANKVTFTQTLTSDQLTPSTTYYYRAYFYDDYDYYYSNSDSFTTKDLPVDTGTQLPDVPGTDF